MDYDRFASATSRMRPSDREMGRSTRPVINVSWYDAVAYANWLSAEDGLTPRVPDQRDQRKLEPQRKRVAPTDGGGMGVRGEQRPGGAGHNLRRER